MKYIYKERFTSSIFYEEILRIINCGLIQLLVMGGNIFPNAHITYASVTLRKNIMPLRLTGMHYLKYCVIIARERERCFERGVPPPLSRAVHIAKLFVPAYWI